MEDEFQLPVMFNDQELFFPAILLNYGYSYKLKVTVNGTNVLFEPDEERNWRALITEDDLKENKKINADLLKAVAHAIDAIVK